MSRDIQQRRDWIATGWLPVVAKRRAVANSEPRCSPEIASWWPSRCAFGEGSTRRERSCSTQAPTRTTGVSGTARREGKALNVGDLDRSEWQSQPRAQGCQAQAPGRRGVGRVHGTCEDRETGLRDGALPDDATPAAKEWRLW